MCPALPCTPVWDSVVLQTNICSIMTAFIAKQWAYMVILQCIHVQYDASATANACYLLGCGICITDSNMLKLFENTYMNVILTIKSISHIIPPPYTRWQSSTRCAYYLTRPCIILHVYDDRIQPYCVIQFLDGNVSERNTLLGWLIPSFNQIEFKRAKRKFQNQRPLFDARTSCRILSAKTTGAIEIQLIPGR